jgi:hypothetical protein
MLLVAGAASIVLATSGCHTWGRWGKWDDDGFPAEEQKLTENVRPREPNSTYAGVSTKARQVERNLGKGGE